MLDAMLAGLRRHHAQLRQAVLPPVLRIHAPAGTAWEHGAAHAVALALGRFQAHRWRAEADWRQRLAEAEQRLAGASKGALDDGFVVALCNERFRLERNLTAIEALPKPPRQARRLRSALDDLSWLFERYAVACVDLTGQRYDVGRLDFEPLAGAETSPQVSAPTITLCERPAVFLAGRLLQTAKGIVTNPA